MFKFTNKNIITQVIILISTIAYFVIFLYLQNNLFLVTNVNNTFINKDIYKLYTVIYISILIVMLVIVLLNRFILLTSITPILVFIIFAVTIFVLIYTNSMFVFFIMYELLLILTAIIVYFNSQNIRSKTITFYFLF